MRLTWCKKDDYTGFNLHRIVAKKYVKKQWRCVKKNNGYIGKKKSKKDMLEFPVESLASFQYREDKPVTKFVEQINDAVDTNIYQKFSYRWITQWLKKNEYLKEDFYEELQKVVTMPTEKGERIGIRAERKKSLNGNEYLLIVYGREAQEFVVGHEEEIMEGRG